MSQWYAIMIDMPYTLPQDEFVKLFSRSCNKPISSILWIQKYCTFEDALAQAKLIEEAKVRDGYIKLWKKEPNNNNNERYQNNNN